MNNITLSRRTALIDLASLPLLSAPRRLAIRFIQIAGRHYGTKVVIYTAPDFCERNDLARLK